MIKNGSTGVPRYPISVSSQIDEDEWESFWPDAVNGTMFNSLRFLSYHPQGRFNSHHATFRRKGNLVGIFPAVIITEEDGSKSWVSHPGASYGGLAWSSDLSYHYIESLVKSLVEYARKAGFSRIRLTPPPVIYRDHHDQAFEFALLRCGFSAIRTELTQAVRLDTPEKQLLESFVNKTRNAYRRAEKLGLKFKIIENPTKAELDRFWDILVENRAGLGVVPTHTRDEIGLLHQLMPENLMLAVIEYEGKMVTTIWNFICNQHTILEFYMAHEEPYQKLKPVPFLTYHTILWAMARGYKYLDFGISSDWGNPTWGLLRFKENFGARNYLRVTYQKELT